MRSSIFAKWARGHRFESHLVLPGIISLLLMAMYFSGSVFLQQIVAPTLDRVPLYSAREFGALEMLQNCFLLGIVFYTMRCLLAARDSGVQLVALLLVVVSVFTFLVEIDYGAHFIEFLTGEHSSLAQETWTRNWHNKTNSSSVQYASYMEFVTIVGVLVGFVFAPLFLSGVRNPSIRLLLPSKWMISTVILVVLLSILAHNLDDAGYSVIGGRTGNLHKNISEFRELNMYYLFLLYSAILHERIIHRQEFRKAITRHTSLRSFLQSHDCLY